MSYKPILFDAPPQSEVSKSEDVRPREFADPAPSSIDDAGPSNNDADWFDALMDGPMRVARAALIERFEREYVLRLLAACDQNVAEAARRSGVDRATLFRIIRRGRLRPRPGEV